MEKQFDKIILDGNKKGIVYEEWEEFPHSVFSEVYENAEKLTKQIIDENKAYFLKYEEYGKAEIENTITFVGPRGSGKTSAMLSFMRRLTNNSKKENHMSSEINKDVGFIDFDSIDASLLENTEDIFNVILAKMFGEFLKLTEKAYGRRSGSTEYEARQLNQEFEKTSRHLKNIRNKDFYDMEENLTALRGYSRSSEIREDFQKLVQLYIQFYNKVNFNDSLRNSYLVISIDDIDLNSEHGYDILGKIYKYMMIPKLIILLALDYDGMLICCEKKYISEYKSMPVDCIGDISDRAKKLSSEYLRKVLPIYMRVYLPVLKQREGKYNKICCLRIADKELEMKQGIFYLIYKKTGMFYDACGKKRHFLEATNLRSLGGSIKFYTQMEDFLPGDQSVEEALNICEHNYFQIFGDLFLRYTSDSLPYKEKMLFEKWADKQIERRGSEIVTAVQKEMKNKSSQRLFFDQKFYGYAYGDLVGAMYDIRKDKLFDKKLVHALLQQYTVVYTHHYIQYMMEELSRIEKKGRRNLTSHKHANELIKLMGGSVAGGISERLFILYEKNGINMHKYVKMDKKYASDVPISIVYMERFRDQKPDGITREFKDFIQKPEIEAALGSIFFYSSYKVAENGKIGYTLSVLRNVDGPGAMIKIKGKKLGFNVLNFVHNCFNYEDIAYEFYEALGKALSSGQDENSFQSIIEECIEERKTKEGTLLNDLKKWTEETGGLALPVYNLDIMYNLFKRLIEGGEFRQNVGNTIECIKITFEEMIERLKKQDEFYNEIEKNISGFRTTFESCPIVSRILEESEETKTWFLNIAKLEDTLIDEMDVWKEASSEPHN